MFDNSNTGVSAVAVLRRSLVTPSFKLKSLTPDLRSMLPEPDFPFDYQGLAPSVTLGAHGNPCPTQRRQCNS